MNAEMTRQELFLKGLDRAIARERANLINGMRRLAARLTEEADRLEADPGRDASPNGYIACVSTSEDIDNGSVKLATMAALRRELLDALKAA